MINLNSKISQKVLSYFLLNPEEELYMNEIVKKFSVDRGNLVKKLSEWEKEGILNKTKRGNLSLYKINKHYSLLEEMKKIVQKSFGLEEKLRTIFVKIKGLKRAFIFGSYASNKLEPESDIDILIVGSHKSLEVEREIIKLEKEFDREINIIDMTESEFLKKKKNNEFVSNIFSNKYIQII
jgi:predicted nucleotidyltransferase